MSSTLYNESRLPIEMDRRVHEDLRDGEQLLWVGQPIPSRFARRSIPLMLFGIPFAGFAIFWMAAASGILFGGRGNGNMGLFGMIFPLFGLPFLLVGLGMVSSPYWYRQRAKKTFYAVTDQRVILWTAGWFGRMDVRAYTPDRLEKMRRVEYGNGDGDLILEEYMTIGRDSDGHQTSNMRRHGLMGIANVREVEELIRKGLIGSSD